MNLEQKQGFLPLAVTAMVALLLNPNTLYIIYPAISHIILVYPPFGLMTGITLWKVVLFLWYHQVPL